MKISTRTAAEIQQTPLRTIWRDRLIIGALNLLAGEPGSGKSSLTALMAAELSRQGHTIVISNCEDDPGSVTVPRLQVADAILERVHVIPPEDAPLFPQEIEALEYVIREVGVKALFLDPIGAHFRPERLVHDRPALRRLASVARATNCAIIAVHHTTKAGEVGGPNAGLIGTSRAVYLYGYDPEDEDRRALSCEKINGVASPPTLLFEHEAVEYNLGSQVVEAGRLRKVRQSNVRAQRRRGRKDPERDAACHAWLSELLAGAPDCAVASKEVEVMGVAEGYAQATLHRAKVELQVEHARVGGYGGNGHWVWRLSDDHPLRTGALEDVAEG
jgi:energy-coupling factor transporter ATP-binding protein EcfA2